MDDYLRSINTTVFKEWVLSQNEPGITIGLDPQKDHIICLDGKQCHGEIRFNPMDIIEMEVLNKQGQNIFYLHFQMGNYNHALDLYHQMVEAMAALNNRTHVRILLSCTGGLTTSLFAMQLNEGAQVMGLDYEFEAVAYTKLFQTGKQFDVILLAPQIGYKKAEAAKVFPKQIVETLPGAIFAGYNVAGAFDLIKQLLDEQAKTQQLTDSYIPLKRDVHNPGRLLAIAVVRHYDETRIYYRLYDHNDVVDTYRVVKPRFCIDDLQDGIDAMMAKYPGLTVVGLSVPMRIYDDIVMLPLEEATHQDFLDYLKERYPETSFYWFNDADSLAVGYYVSQNDYENLSFMFLPRLNDLGGIGSIFNGQLILGKESLAGEPRFYIVPFFGNELDELRQSVEGATRIIAVSLLPVIALLAPEAIIINCVMMPDTELLKTMLKEYLPEHFLPDLIKVTPLNDYMLLGTMVSCVNAHHK